MPTFRKTEDVELHQLKSCLNKLIDDLTVRGDKAAQAPAADALAKQVGEARALVLREQALTLRYLMEAVEALDPLTEETKFKGTVLMAASKASLNLRKTAK
jgi:hypothetical protein